MPYRRGDYKVVCERCGFHRYRSECVKEHTGAVVCKKCYEPKHPQQFVRARRDKQRVADPHPDTDEAMAQTTLNGALSVGATSVVVDSAVGIEAYDSIGIVTDWTGDQPAQSGVTTDSVALTGKHVFWTHVTAKSGTTLTIAEALDRAASDGNTVYTRGSSLLTWTEVGTTDL